MTITATTVIALIMSTGGALGAMWTLGVFVFSPRMRDTIEATIDAKVNGKIDTLTEKVDQLATDAHQRHTDTEKRLAVGSAKMDHLETDLERLRGDVAARR